MAKTNKQYSKLWEWSSQADTPASASKKASLAYPEDAQQTGTTLIPVVNKTFQGETVIIDGRNFINCEFNSCNIQWNGNDFIFSTCSFDGAQKLVTPLAEIAAALKLADICDLLDQNIQCSESRPAARKSP